MTAQHPLPGNLHRKTQLRLNLRQRRRRLSRLRQTLASRRISQRAMFYVKKPHHRHIGFYFANDGELNPAPLIDAALQYHKQCYLPSIGANGILEFRLLPNQGNWREQLVRGRYGIYTAKPKQPKKRASELDLVFVPLVGFDSKKRRLGMGGGYYDRSFAYRNNRSWTHTKLIGLAHRCQQVDELPKDDWDIKLDKILCA